MGMALQVNIRGATTFRDSTKQMLAQIEQNTVNEAFQLTKLVQEDIIRNSKTMIPHKYSSLNRLNNNQMPLAQRINILHFKNKYEITVPEYAIYLDKGAKVNVKKYKGKTMKWISAKNGEKVYSSKDIIHPGNPAYFFISTALARLPKLAEDAGYRITKKNQRFYKWGETLWQNYGKQEK